MIKILLFLLFGLVTPGYVLARRIMSKNILLRIFLSICLSFVFITLTGLVGGYLNFRALTPLMLLLLNGAFFYKKYYLDFRQELGLLITSKSWKKEKYFLVVVLLILGGIIFQNSITFPSGRMYDFGIGYWGPLGHDGIWHQALINQLIKKVPPENPGFVGQTLSNYHYFYDLLVAETTRIINVSVSDLIYRFYPILFSLLLGMGTCFLALSLFTNKLAVIFSLFFVYFGSSFGWVIEFIRERHFGGESSFWMNQPVSMNLNPPFAISLILIIAIILLFNAYQKEKQLSLVLALILITGTLIEFKVYAGLIVLGAVLLISTEKLIFERDISLFKLFLPSLFFALMIFLPQNTQVGGFIVFKPFWFIHAMIDSLDRVGWLKLANARMAYTSGGVWFKLLLAEIISLAIFIIGNLGTRIIGLITIVNLGRRNVFNLGQYYLIGWMMAISLFIPLIFIQKGNPWNTIQFSYYFLYFFALFAGFTLAKISVLKPKILAFCFLFLILAFTPISSFTTFTFGFYANPPSTLPKAEIKVLEYLKEQPQGVVLTYPFDKKVKSSFTPPYPLFSYDTTNYVSAFSNKPVFIEDEIQQEILGNKYQERVIMATSFFSEKNEDSAKKFLEEYNISYIYFPEVFNYPLKNDDGLLELLMENDGVYLYKIRR